MRLFAFDDVSGDEDAFTSYFASSGKSLDNEGAGWESRVIGLRWFFVICGYSV